MERTGRDKGVRHVDVILKEYTSQWSKSQFGLLERIYGGREIKAPQMLTVKMISHLTRSEADMLLAKIDEGKNTKSDAVKKIHTIYLGRKK